MTPKSASLALIGTLALGSGAFAATTLSVKDQMKQVVEPASSTLFSVGGDVDPANGPDAAKVPASRWKEAADAALTLKAVAATLNERGRAQAGPEWAAFVKQMGDASETAAKAAATRDGAGLSTAANALSDNCSACHAKFKPQTAS